MSYVKKGYYDYDSAFRFALKESHEELSNIVKNKLWYIKKKEDVVSLLEICFKEEDIPLKTIEMIIEASSYKAKTLLQKINNPFWSCIIHQQEDKFDYLLKQGLYQYQGFYKSLPQVLVEFNHLNLFKISACYARKLPIDKETLKALFINQFEQCHVDDYALIMTENYSIKSINKMLLLAQEIDTSSYASNDKTTARKDEFIAFMEKFLMEKKQNCDIIVSKSDSLEPNKRFKI